MQLLYTTLIPIVDEYVVFKGKEIDRGGKCKDDIKESI